MSRQRIQQYYRELDEAIRFGGSYKESAIKTCFQNLLNDFCKTKELRLIPEIEYKNKRIRPDGTIRDIIQQDWGYWESKDKYDNLEHEIAKKFALGYPQTNILFEDSISAIIIRNGEEIMRCTIRNEKDFERLLNEFVSYEPPEIAEFKEALKKFSEHVPALSNVLRKLLHELELPEQINSEYISKRDSFLKLCKNTINPDFSSDNIREMIIQHILTEEIFTSIYDETQFHKENNVASELQSVVDTFFYGNLRRITHENTKSYLEVIKARASQIGDHHRKQDFLNLIYEEFYTAYNPKGADRLGIVYTPHEIVKFIIESSEHLTFRHFGKLLSDKNVEILDPCTGTGTFITELIDFLPHNLAYKYEHEIHANEVSILPYYIANLNIEYSYLQKTKSYKPYKNICFVDTLDNINPLNYAGKQILLWDLSAENAQRIQQQNEKKISVIIGNPPYNANQMNENENNKNREYAAIDDRIKKTYIKESAAQKTKVYDMYARFLRWATDRLDKNGIIGFVSNNSFINSRTYDGFRKTIAKDFNEIYIIDLKGNARTSGNRRQQEGGNVFDDKIRVGVAIYFLVRNEKLQGCKIFYNCIDDYVKSDAKRKYLIDNKLQDIPFEHIRPDRKGNWINQADNDFETFIPIANRTTKLSKTNESEQAIFKLYSLGVVTARDEWVYDFDKKNLTEKVKFLINVYNSELKKFQGLDKKEIAEKIDYQIKWSRAVKKDLQKGKKYKFDKTLIIESLYRPFVKKQLYYSTELNEMQYQMNRIFGNNKPNIVMCIKSGNRLDFTVLCSNIIPSLAVFSLDPAQCVSMYRYDNEGTKTENITDWALQQFRTEYNLPTITKQDIFNYCYAVLHNPQYRTKYEFNLKRDFPRIPFYNNFEQWSKWGEQLLYLHLNYETVKPAELTVEHKKMKNENEKPKPRLIVNKDKGLIEIDTLTTLKNIPDIAWNYKLGSRSALEWIVEQYKESKIHDKTIAQNFDNYRFTNYKTEVIELIQKVCTVSIETMKITNLMTEN